MNEFEWQRQLRSLAQPREPQKDLWQGIANGISAQNRLSRRRVPRMAFAIAASAVIICTTAIVSHRSMGGLFSPLFSQEQASVESRTALDWATPANPTLAIAAQDLDNASADLQQALEQRPEAVFLVGLLNRTNSQRMRLLQQAPYSG